MEINREHIRHLLFEKIGGTISEADNELVDDAIRNDSEIAALWQEIQNEFDPPHNTFLAQINEDEDWKKVKARLQPRKGGNARLIRLRLLQAAAVVLCISIAGIFYLSSRSTNKQPGQQAAAIPSLSPASKSPELKLADGSVVNLSETGKKVNAKGIKLSLGNKQLSYATGNDKDIRWASLQVPAKLDYQLLLPDGSKVWLNASSSLRFPYAFYGNTREVYLEGEGYFEVAKNAARPFIVHAGKTDVKVLGTSFNINTYETNKTITSLVEGSVLTTAGSDSLKLMPGRQAIYSNTAFSTSPFEATNVLSWMQGISYFNNTKLSDISAIIARWYDVKVVIEDQATLNQTFSGAINKHKPIQVFLTNIAISSGIQSRIDEKGTIYLK
ncbi:DUF4974 domain-containing protein [Paraflavitalea soli]|uniref:DUF4974 domain-containing protein n=1 Tax=Paraflavitalea soli TaxID=2315862 RepID=A0A3B7MET4_9BACT|nr:FecR domain-containing protein [Paraflavitalea soli]AXY72812.1 DUF4974 domain-containing protein [Paraflavitalea soli]